MSTIALPARKSRERPWTLAAAFYIAVLNVIVTFATMPIGLSDVPAFALVVGLISAALWAIGAWGLWNYARWAAVLLFVITALNALGSFGGIFEAPSTALRVLCAIGMPIQVAGCVLLVVRPTRSALR